MYLKVAKTITSLVVLLMLLEILGAAATPLSPCSTDADTVHPSKSLVPIFGSFLFEKAEEETEKTEEEKDGIGRVVLIDFSRIAFSLSFYHTPQVQLPVLTGQYNVRPPLHALNCTFLI